MSDGVRLERDGPVATVILDRPAALNALTIPMKVALAGALETLATDPEVRTVILTGEGRAFCAGQDLGEREAADAPPLDVELRERYLPIVRALRAMPQPVVAAVNGVAAGAGAALAFASDVRVAGSDARFVLAFGRIGLVPDSGATWFLPRLVGAAHAADLALVGDPVDAESALRIGLVSRVVPAERLREEALALAGRIAAGSPPALAATKRLLGAAWTTDRETARACAPSGRSGRHASATGITLATDIALQRPRPPAGLAAPADID
jgi:2-(1,2-epoxy-1,2-dihydrophenyl)acetyl-CoA isomerase